MSYIHRCPRAAQSSGSCRHPSSFGQSPSCVPAFSRTADGDLPVPVWQSVLLLVQRRLCPIASSRAFAFRLVAYTRHGKWLHGRAELNSKDNPNAQAPLA